MLLEAGKMKLAHLHTLPQGSAGFLVGPVLKLTSTKNLCEDEGQPYLLFNLSQTKKGHLEKHKFRCRQ